MKLGLVVALGCALGALGCGPSTGSPSTTGGAGTGGGAAGTGGGAAGTPGTAQAFCEQVRSTFAANSSRCYGGTVADWSGTAEYCTSLGKLTTTIHFDASMAKDCLATLVAKTAAECSPEVPCLDQVIKGLIPDGQACTHSAECGPNVNCLSPDDTTCAQKTCAAPAPPGATCFPYCDDNGICDPDTNTCLAIVRVDVGGTCGDQPTRLCKSELTCVYNTTGVAGGICMTRPAVGCEGDFDCMFTEEFCDLATSTCKPRLKMGAPCTDAPTGCAISTTCNAVTNRCAKAGHPGEPCASEFGICFSGFCDFSDAAAPTCASFRPLGARCDLGGQCGSGVCHNGVCTDCPR